MTNETQTKFAAILAAAQNKANIQATPKFTEPVKPEPTPETKQPEPPSKMGSFTIIWQEGSGRFDGKVFTKWNDANDAMRRIYNEHSGQGYLKVKINVKWENGSEITDRADCSDSAGDFCPKRGTIGEYLKKQNSVMYGSNLNEGDRVNLSFEDEGPFNAANYSQPEPEPQPATDKPELSTFTIEDILTGCEPAEDDTEGTEPPKNRLEIVDYSDKAFAVIGETKPIKEVLRSLGGRFNNFLTCGPGWIFSKTRFEAVKVHLSL